MKTQKLSLNDFEAVGTNELLQTKGGYRPSVNHSRTAILQEGGGGGGGGTTGCPKCDEAGETTRCNGSRHSPDFWETMKAGWDGLLSLGGITTAGTGGVMTGGAYSIPFGMMNGASNHVQDSLDQYHNGLNTSGGSSSGGGYVDPFGGCEN